MKDEIPKYLYDIREAAKAIIRFVDDKTFDDYSENEMLRSAVERKFEIIGEALNRIKKDDPSVLQQIRDQRKIISFRNILIHGYDNIDDRIVWEIIEEDLENLLDDIKPLI